MLKLMVIFSQLAKYTETNLIFVKGDIICGIDVEFARKLLIFG